MTVQITLVDINPKMVRAWRDAFDGEHDVAIVHGSLLAQPASAWVSPTNARGRMDGGVDAAVRGCLGARIQTRLRRAIVEHYDGAIPVGYATCVATGRTQPAYLVSTPTMTGCGDDVRATLNTALACCAALQAVQQRNAIEADAITSVAIPGLGSGTGRVPEDACADLMWTAYQLFREQRFTDFESMHTALESELGPLDGRSSREAARALRAAMFA